MLNYGERSQNINVVGNYNFLARSIVDYLGWQLFFYGVDKPELYLLWVVYIKEVSYPLPAAEQIPDIVKVWIALDIIENISIQGSPFKGPQDAPVVIAEFSDFE